MFQNQFLFCKIMLKIDKNNAYIYYIYRYNTFDIDVYII